MTWRLGRRALTRAIAVGAVAPSLWLPRRARAEAAGDTEIRSIEAGELGWTIILGMRNGPYPYAGAKWTDDSTLVFVPRHYRAREGDGLDAHVEEDAAEDFHRPREEVHLADVLRVLGADVRLHAGADGVDGLAEALDSLGAVRGRGGLGHGEGRFRGRRDGGVVHGSTSRVAVEKRRPRVGRRLHGDALRVRHL